MKMTKKLLSVVLALSLIHIWTEQRHAEEIPTVQHQQKKVCCCSQGQGGAHQTAILAAGMTCTVEKAQQQCSVFQSCTDRKNALQVAAEKGEVKHCFRSEKPSCVLFCPHGIAHL